MRPPARLLQPLEAPSLRLSRTLYVCSNCRSPSSAVSQQHQTRRHAGGSTPFTEKLRRRLWGTDNPPGLKDPYGGEGVIAKAWNKRKPGYVEENEQNEQNRADEQLVEEEEPKWEEEEEVQAVKESIPEPVVPVAPSMRSHTLERIGYLGEWKDFPATESDEYYPFVSRKKATTKAHFRTAAQSVAVELCLLHELKKPFSLAYDLTTHHEEIWNLIKQCRITESSNAASLDNVIEFPNEEIKKQLLFVFKQLGEPAESPSKKNVQEENVKEENVQEEDVKNKKSKSSAQKKEVYSFALKAKEVPEHVGYLSFPLADPEIKFAYLKRLAQITGHYVQDISAHNAKTVLDVLSHLEKHVCEPKKLAQQLDTMKSLQKLHNVQINFKRYTKEDQDREVGRAKVIEEALRERGLLEKDIKKNEFRL